MTTNDVLHSTLQVVIAQSVKHAAEVCKCALMCFKEGLLCSVGICNPTESAALPQKMAN
jgi:hypothetical protein